METVFLVLRVAVSLGVVLAVIWWAHRRITAGRARTRKTELVTIVGRQALAPKASVVVVDADGRRLTLGVTEHGVSVLHDREAPEPEAAPAARPVAVPVPLREVGSSVLETRPPSSGPPRPAVLADMPHRWSGGERRSRTRIETTPDTDRSSAAAPADSAAFDELFAAFVEAPTAPTAPATHGSRRGSFLSAETWKRSLAGVKEGLGI